MKSYKVKISDDALLDIQEAASWYEERLPGLGERFKKAAKLQIKSLKSNAHGYSIRYSEVHCVVIKKFPFLIHFIIDEKDQIIEIFAIFHTSRNPKIWNQRFNNI
jgi:plasmid stabilization system protein ParE